MPGTMLDWVPHMPARLKELRQEVGWTLDDVAKRVGVTQRGVVSNWEATNQRHRIPDISNLLILQRWYGVSMDYLLGEPGAERDSPAVRQGKLALRTHLQSISALEGMDPSDRARLVIRTAAEIGPAAFFTERLALWLMLAVEDLQRLQDPDSAWPRVVLDRLGPLVGLSGDWFYSDQPKQALKALA